MHTANRKNKLSTLIGSDMLWALVIMAGFLFFTSLVPLPPNDYWWHIRVGEQVFTEHTIPTTNQYSWTVSPDQPYIYSAWLGELLLYLLHRLGGLELSIFTRTVLVGAAYWLVGVEARRTSGSWRVAALVLALLCLMSTNNLIVRPQMWAWLPFVIIYTCLSQYSAGQGSWKSLLICPVLMILWVNLHGSFVLGLGLMGLYLVGELIRRQCKMTGALSIQQLRWLAGATVVSTMSTLVNPRIAGIIAYIQNLLSNKPVQKLIEEWQPPTPHGLANLIFFGSIMLLIIALATSQARLTPSELLLTLAFLWLAWSSQRSVAWYGIVVMPLLGKVITGIPFRTPVLPIQKNILNIVIVIIAFLPTVLVQPWLIDQFPLPASYRAQIQNNDDVGPLLSLHTPIGAARYLNDYPGGRTFNELGYGSYLIWAVRDQSVFIDPRIELYPQEIWDDYIKLSNGTNVTFLLHKYQIDQIILDTELQSQLSASLRNESAWQLEYSDQVSEVWRTSVHNGVQ